jgi:TatD DNase family protein
MLINIHTHNNFSNKLNIRNLTFEDFFDCQNNFFSLGIHPWYVNDYSYEKLKDFEKIIDNKNFIAIGEIGIDKVCNSNLDLQKKIFESQIKIAQKYNKVIIIHCVRAYDLILFYRKKYINNYWILHDFNSNLQIANKLIEKKVFLSFGKNLIFESNKSIEVLKNISLDYIFFETDNEEFDIFDVYNKASQILKIDIKEIEIIIQNNFKRVFNYEF